MDGQQNIKNSDNRFFLILKSIKNSHNIDTQIYLAFTLTIHDEQREDTTALLIK
jgi:hypothetical protein